MKQKIVLKVQMTCEKCRRNAMKVAVAAPVAIQGNEKDELVLIGMSLDATCLTKKLRKKVGYASIVSVEEVKEEKKTEGKQDKVEPTPIQFSYGYPSWPPCNAIPIQDEFPSACNIL
ncbi:hypothetical protein Ancab_024870 [Ancistrocladus abbreviatus]